MGKAKAAVSKLRKTGVKQLKVVPPKKVTPKKASGQKARSQPFITDFDMHLLQGGKHIYAYKKLGAHITESNGMKGVNFAVWAPNASRVSVVGDFNSWDGNKNVMMPSDSGVWQIFIPGLVKGQFYKYELLDHSGNLLPLKADPYQFYSERPPSTASVVWDLPNAKSQRGNGQTRRDAISIYEVHLGSWRRGLDNEILSYKDFAEQLVSYAKDMGFTHIELLPISEHPFDGSWGYQPTGLFAPTSRFGTPDEFKSFIDAAHKAGVKVLLDWVPGHFPNDAHGLAKFDGTHLYEHADPREGEHKDWGTLIYNYGRNEVLNFLVSNTVFWMEQYGIDGLRVDAVASMIYRNYSRKADEWVPNIYGGVENLEATAFLKRMNETVYGEFPDTVTVAEESTAWAGVSKPTYDGGLGFGFKWNMGWMHDTLEYMQLDPIHRKYHHDKMTFGMIYAYTENFVLPLSHDEVVHGKGSLLGKMPGDEWQKFANLRAYYGFMFGHPGKKLLFMGAEFGQSHEWNHDQSLDWHLLENNLHKGVQNLVRDLNNLYRNTPALYINDAEPKGFEWLDNNVDYSIFVFTRRGDSEKELAIVVSNFTPTPHENYRIGVPLKGFYTESLNSDAADYGGSGMGNYGGLTSEATPYNGQPHSISLTVPPLATLIFTYKGTK